jgi:hypothetical protein
LTNWSVHRGQRQSTSGGDPVGNSVSALLLRINAIWTVRTGSFELLAIGGAALTLAGTLPVEERYSQPWTSALDWLIKSGRFIFAIALVVFGLDHFLFLRFVASLVPPWILWHLFWAFFFGCAFMAAGVSIATKWMGEWGATLIGTMFLLWFFVLHFTYRGYLGWQELRLRRTIQMNGPAHLSPWRCGEDPGFALGRCLHRGRKALDRFKITAGGGWDLFPTEC